MTAEGRIIAVILMLTGIGVIGIFTATVASLFCDDARHDPTAALNQRLDHVERKLDAILDRLDSPDWSQR